MIGASAWLLSGAFLYAPVLIKLARDWRTDATYSHGFLVLPIALFLVWRQRDRLRDALTRPSTAGLAILAFGLALFIAGSLGAELFLTRISMIFVLAGTVVFAFGWNHLRLVSFPLGFLVFMIPLPAIVFDRIAVSLQLVASRLGEQLLQAADVPVLRDGNILTLARATLEVNDACSGIRSLIALLSMTMLAGYLFEPSAWRRAFVTTLAVPLTVALNGVRIAITGMATSRFGPRAAQGLFHESMGWVVFVAALACVWGLYRATQSWPAPAVVNGRLEAA